MGLLLRSIAFSPSPAERGLPDGFPPDGLFASTVDASNSVNHWLRQSGSRSENGIWGTVLLAIVLLWVGFYFWHRSRRFRNQAGDDREGLFVQLCELHKLSKRDRQLLRTVAKRQELHQPALAFVDPRILLDFAENSPSMSVESLALLDRLFGESLVKEIVSGSVSGESSAKP